MRLIALFRFFFFRLLPLLFIARLVYKVVFISLILWLVIYYFGL